MTKGGIVGASTNRCLLELVFKIGGIGGGEEQLRAHRDPVGVIVEVSARREMEGRGGEGGVGGKEVA